VCDNARNNTRCRKRFELFKREILNVVKAEEVCVKGPRLLVMGKS
jgi:hypothetical protein